MERDRTASLLDELGWLQQLARELAADPDAAADAVQDTCALALQHGEAVAHPRAFLATVLRNCLRLRARGDRRRQRRDVAASRPEATAGTAELVQRAELQQRLLAAVMDLPAVHRDVVLLRFFDDLPPRAIAARLQAPVATVHSRLQRALHQLRQELDRGDGGRRGWLALALPAVPAVPALPVAAPPALALGVLMHTKWMVAAALVVAAGTLTFLWPSLRSDPIAATEAPAPSRHRGGSGGGAGDANGAVAAAAARGERTAVPAPAAAPPHDVARVAVRGRVCDCTALPLAGVPVSVRGDATTAPCRTDGSGRFELRLPAQPCSLTVDDERFVTVLGAAWNPSTTIEPVLVVAPVQRIAGTVVDPAGTPLPNAHFAWQLPAEFDARLPLPLDRAERMGFAAVTRADGAFRLPRLPRIDGASLVAVAEARRPATVPLPPGDDERMQVVLQPFAYEAGQLDGVVVDPTGAPVPGARVAMGLTSTVTDAAGRFGLVLRRAGWPTAIVACKAGYLPGRVELPRGGGAERAEWPDRIELRLGREPLTMHGRVVGADGRPVPGAIVWASDPTLFGIAGIVPLQVEYLLAGGQVPPNVARMPVRFADEPTTEGHFTDQMAHMQEPNACWFFVEADDGGAFELPGLLPRDYVLRALDPASGVTGDAPPTPAGGTVEIRIGSGEVWPVLKGRVVSLRGDGVPGVDVLQCVLAFRANERVPGGRFEGSAIRHGKRTKTAADGSFELRDVDARHTFLSLYGDSILPRALWTKDVADPTQVEIRVAMRCHVEVALLDPAEADQVAARDEKGETVDVVVLRSGSHRAETELSLHAGRSGVFVLDERATKLLLLRDGAVVREVPLRLVPGQTTLVQ